MLSRLRPTNRVLATTGRTSNKARRGVSTKPTVMTHSEAFVETLASRGVTDVFGIVGSAFMDALDIFPPAGIRFISVQHEQNAAHMADGYARVSGRHGVCIAQNGPGITNFVTGIAAAYHAHSPVIAITPEAGTATKGLGGFQEVDQMPIFSSITKWQVHVNNANRMAELTARAFDTAIAERGPVQLNIPRDYYYGEAAHVIPPKVDTRLGAGDPQALELAAQLIRSAKNPVILSGGGVVMGEAVAEVQALAELLGSPVCNTYLHNDSFPSTHPLWCGPLGYLGHKTAMNSISEADVVIALGTRLGPFGTLPQYNFEYWPQNAKVIQVDADRRALGRTRPVDVGVWGDVKQATSALTQLLVNGGKIESSGSKGERAARLEHHRRAWEAELDKMTTGEPIPPEGRIKPRLALRELERAMPKDAMVSTDIGNSCSVSNSYLRFATPRSFFAAMTFGNCGYAFPAIMGAKVARPNRPAVAYAGEGAWGMSLNEVLTCVRENIPTTAVVFNNGQWGAEKKNQVLWFGDRYIGTQLDNPAGGFSGIARAMGAEGITCTHHDQVGPALLKAVEDQMKHGKTTVVELMTSRELGDPFRRDAMKLPQRRLQKYKHTDREEESPTGQPVDL